jgi:hypothetical protein
MPDLDFRIESVEVPAYAAVPQLAFKVRLSNASDGEPIHSVVLRAQIQIDATRRRYNPREQGRLKELFGDPDRWSRTLRPMLWTHATVVVPPFTHKTLADLPVSCTFDFNVAATKYFWGLEQGELPLVFLFSGSVFYASALGNLQVAPISWDKEAAFRLPVHTWHQLMESYYPNGAWLRLRKDVFDRLQQYKMRTGTASWEDVFERLLASVEDTVRS